MNYEQIKTVLLGNVVRETIFRISFFVDGLQERVFVCVRRTFSGSSVDKIGSERLLFRNVLT